MNKFLKYLFFIVSVFFINTEVISQQSEYLLRSTTSNAGSSVILENEDERYLIQQSFGQSSPAGLVQKTDFVARQGFIQPYILAKLAGNTEPLGFDVYPNPTLGDLYIDIEESYEGVLETSLYDYRGRVVFRKSFRDQKAIKLDLREIAQGSYFLRVIVNNKQRVVQINKQR
ncbi:T9SS type A sorting domain-containing protein [Flavobacteriales bacterium]|nr:T9SS type A sorting domain-containing protein [Flavobacteriales bacterium]